MKKIEMIDDQCLETLLKAFLEQKQLPDSFLYIREQGKDNWLALESNKRFPIASSLTTLLCGHSGPIVALAKDVSTLVSIGAGDAKKELLLLTELLKFSKPSCQLVDVSGRMVDRAMETLSGLPIDVKGVTAFCEDMEILAQYWDRPVLLCLLGNNFCNYDPTRLLPQVWNSLNANDLFLFDCHLFSNQRQNEETWTRDIEEVYNSAENAKFNTAPLVSRGMDPDCCRFELKLVKLPTPWGQVYRTMKRIYVIEQSMVQCGNDEVVFAPGDVIEMGFTYKYRLDQLLTCLHKYDFNVVQSWPDATGDNVIVLAGTI